MYTPPKIWVFYLIALGNFARADFQPLAIPEPSLPADARNILSVARTPNAWIVAGKTVARRQSGVWSSMSVPNKRDIGVAIAFKDGVIVGGVGFCEIYNAGKWTSLPIDDTLYFGTGNGDEALLAGQRGIYHIASDGSWKLIFPGTRDNLYYLHTLGKRLIASTVEKGLLEWDAGREELVPFDGGPSWGKNRNIISLQQLENGAFYVASTAGFFIEDATGEHPILPDVSASQLRGGLYATFLLDRTLVALNYRGGISAYSVESGQQLWTIPADSTGAAVLELAKFDRDLVVGSGSGLSVIPDPLTYSFQALPKENILVAANINGEIVVGADRAGVVDLKGVERFGTDFALTQLPNGEVVEGRFARIVYKGQFIDFSGQWVADLAPLGNDWVAFRQMGTIGLAQLSTKKTKTVPIISTPNSLAASTRLKKFFTGTSAGVCQYNEDGTLERTFGQGLVHVRRFRDGIVALDGDGTLYNETGAAIAHLPLTDLIDAEEWSGQLCLLATSNDGLPWVGLVKGGEWKPLDIPFPTVPQALVVKDNDLYIAGPGLMVKTAHPRLLEEPSVDAWLSRGKNNEAQKNLQIPASEDSVYLNTSAGRLNPWRNPRISFRAGSSDWIPLSSGAHIALPRLAWGTTPIVVRSEWGGLSHDEELSVFRTTPWWLRWPAILMYALGLVGIGYAAIRWRTWRLERRAKQLEDVVEQRTAQLRQAQQAREDFFSTMSHEIRNPLNGVVGLCEIVENAPPESVAPRERMLLKTLRGCADQLRSILDDVLDFSRIDRGEIQLHEETFELLGAIEGAARGVDAGLKRCVLELPPAPIFVRGDCGKIRQIVTNLVSNALKYGLPPAARVLLQVEAPAGGTLAFCIRVLNTGNTIPPEEISQIFTGYVRGEDARRRRIVGTGLGLAVSRKIAMAMNGSLNATSQNGLTEFRLDLKLPVTTAPVEVTREINRPKTSRALGIEDEPYNRLVLGSILGQLGYEVDWAADGAEALAHARTGSYDLILTDFMLPDTTGTELARKILQMVADPKPPIIAVTAYSTPEKIQQAKDAGIVGFVTKPVSRKKIEAAILDAVGEFSAGRSVDLPEIPTVECNFSLLLRLPDGAQKLAEYADDLPKVWGRVLASLRGDDPSSQQARVVHAFRSRILAVHATGVAEQLGVLEDAAMREAREDVERLVAVIDPLLKEIERSARSRALTVST